MSESSINIRYLRQFELVLVIIGVLVLIDLTLDRARGLMAEAERLSFIVTVNNLRSAVSYELVRRLAAGVPFDELTQMAGANPITFADPPHNYQGVADGPDGLNMPPGSWYFNHFEQTLVYRVRNLARFSSSLPTRDRVRFRIEARYRDTGTPNGGRHDLLGVELIALDTYRWQGLGED
ncbi:putative Type II secretion system protein GspG C-terminal domain-containing protein [Gammaproteobacteria bacterium]